MRETLTLIPGFVAEGLVLTAHMMQEAADEIEYLRQQCAVDQATNEP